MNEREASRGLALSSQTLPGGTYPQVTHNRLTGSQESRRVLGYGASWLHAFQWSLFCDPIQVWDACEVNGEVGSRIAAPVAMGRNSQHLKWIVTCTPAGLRQVGTLKLDA